MKLPNGQVLKLGDLLNLGGNMTGVVVCCFDEGLFSDDFPKEQWGSLTKGILVNSAEAGLIHYPEYDTNLEIIHQSKAVSRKSRRDD